MSLYTERIWSRSLGNTDACLHSIKHREVEKVIGGIKLKSVIKFLQPLITIFTIMVIQPAIVFLIIPISNAV